MIKIHFSVRNVTVGVHVAQAVDSKALVKLCGTQSSPSSVASYSDQSANTPPVLHSNKPASLR